MKGRQGDRVTIEHGELRLARRRVPLLSGEVHFWRTDPAHWDGILGSAARAGLPIISTYVSWRRHESKLGIVDLVGASDPKLDLRRFVGRCAAHGLLVHLKPGPWICAEEENGGYPDWLLEDRDLWALDAAGEPILGYNLPWQHRVPSYLHPRYLSHVRAWLRAVDRHLAGLFYPDGPIVLVQLDNEPSYAFRDTPFGFDYHPDVIDRFRRWLLRRYGSVGAVSNAWGLELSALESLDPPRSPSGNSPRRGLDWAEFRERLIADYLRRLRGYHDTAGVGGAFFTVNYNEHPIPGVPQDAWRISRSIRGTGGPDLYYEPPLGADDIERLARTLAIARAQDPSLTWAPEIQAGIWRAPGAPTPDPTPGELEFWWLAAIAFGLRGLNLYMLADREHWAEAPLQLDGSPSALWLAVERLTRLTHVIKPWGELTTVAPLAIHRSHAASRAGYALAAGPTDPPEFGPIPEQVWNSAFRALVAAGHLPAVWDSRSPAPPGVETVVLTPPVCLDARERKHLQRFVAEGGAILATGVSADQLRNGRRARVASGRIIELNSVAELAAGLELVGLQPAVTVDAAATLPVLARSKDLDIVFLVRQASEPAMVSMRFATDTVFDVRPVLAEDPEVERVNGGDFRLLMPGRSVRVFTLRSGQRARRAPASIPDERYDGQSHMRKAASETSGGHRLIRAQAMSREEPLQQLAIRPGGSVITESDGRPLSIRRNRW